VNINFSELLVILVVTLLLFGPDKLPEIARQIGKFAAEARKATNAVRREFYNTVYQPTEEIRKEMNAPAEALRSLKAEIMAPPEGARGVSSRAAATSDEQSSSPSSPDEIKDDSATNDSVKQV
jgi:Tat protein translocase TatB subunit